MFRSAAAPKVSFQIGQKGFTFHNVHDFGALNIQTSLPFEMFRNNRVPGDYHVRFEPTGQEHEIAASYNGNEVEGTPFKLAPNPVVVQQHPGRNMFTLKNVYNTNALELSSPTLQFEMRPADNLGDYHVMYNGQGQAHDVSVQYEGQNVGGGNFRLMPSHMQENQRSYKGEHEWEPVGDNWSKMTPVGNGSQVTSPHRTQQVLLPRQPQIQQRAYQPTGYVQGEQVAEFQPRMAQQQQQHNQPPVYPMMVSSGHGQQPHTMLQHSPPHPVVQNPMYNLGQQVRVPNRAVSQQPTLYRPPYHSMLMN